MQNFGTQIFSGIPPIWVWPVKETWRAIWKFLFVQSTHFAVKLDLDDSRMRRFPDHVSCVRLNGLPLGGNIWLAQDEFDNWSHRRRLSIILRPLTLHFNSFLVISILKAECFHLLGQPEFTVINKTVQEMLLFHASAFSSHHSHLCSFPSSHTSLYTLLWMHFYFCWKGSAPIYLPGSFLLFFQICVQIPSSQKDLCQSPIEIVPCAHVSLSKHLSPLYFFSELLSPLTHYIPISLLPPYTH